MSKVCRTHAEKPTMIYGQCIGCELERYQERIKELEETARRYRDALNDIAFGRVEGDYSDMRQHAREAL